MDDRSQEPQEASLVSKHDPANCPLSPSADWTPLELAGRDEQLPTIYTIPNHSRLSGIEGVRRVYIFLEDHHKSASARLPAFSTTRCSAFTQLPKGWLVLGEGDYVFSRDLRGDGQPANDVLRVAVNGKVLKTTSVDTFAHCLVPRCIQVRVPKNCTILWQSPQIHGSTSAANMTGGPVLVSLPDEFHNLHAQDIPGIGTPEERHVDSGDLSE